MKTLLSFVDNMFLTYIITVHKFSLIDYTLLLNYFLLYFYWRDYTTYVKRKFFLKK